MSSRRTSTWVLAGLLAVAGLCTAREAPDPPAAEDRLQLSSDLRVGVRRGRDVELEVRAAPGDSYASLAERVAGGERSAAAIGVWNGGREVEEGTWVRVPLSLLDDNHRRLVLASLFPADRRQGEDWIHVAHSGRLPIYDSGLWQVAEWFTGRGEAFVRLLEANGLDSPELRAGQSIRIPAELLHPAFRAEMISADGELEFGSDARGPYAAYRLEPGEALYSAVAVRYTGRTKAADVVAVARAIAERSGIRDLHDIPVGFEVKIPLDLLEPQFLPAGHPRRVEAEAARAALEAEMARRPFRPGKDGDLRDVVVILDPGHGGRDLGTMNNGIWEHDYVYDVTCRLKEKLERDSAATVFLTLEDRETGCTPSRTDKLEANRQGTILTTPPFLAREDGEARIGVNLRWYLANSILRRLIARGVEPERIVFVSIHADARHPSLSGLMVYVPGAKYCARAQGFNSKTYRRYAEVREKPIVRFSSKQRLRSEALSTEFAREIVRAFREAGLPVQPYQPVRHRIIRGRSVFVPAVLRGNAVPNKVLVEMVNMRNTKDASLLASARGRERMAQALHGSLSAFFGGGADP